MKDLVFSKNMPIFAFYIIIKNGKSQRHNAYL